MKKLLGIVVLGLLLCNFGFAEIKTIYHEKSKLIPVTVFILDVSKEDFKKRKIDITDFETQYTLEDIIKDLNEVNDIWKIGKINFLLQDVYSYKLKFYSKFKKDREYLNKHCQARGSCFDTSVKDKSSPTFQRRKIYNYLTVREIFYNTDLKKKYFGIKVFYLPKMLSGHTCGFATMPKNRYDSNAFYVVIGNKCGKTSRGIVLAHELGHSLGLLHLELGDNLMHPAAVNNNLRIDQLNKAKKSYFVEMLEKNTIFRGTYKIISSDKYNIKKVKRVNNF